MSAEKELMLKQADAETTYQKKLTAGTNITIDPVTNVISSAGGGSTVQYTDNVPNGESVGILAINGQSHPIRIPRLAEGTGITITKDISTNVYTISSTGGGSGTTKSYMGETDPDELVGEDGDLYFKYHKIITVIPTELTLPSLPDEATVPFPITDFNSYESFTFYYTDLNREPHSRIVNTGDLVISDSPADEYPNSNIYMGNSYCFVQATRSTNGEGLVLRVSGNCLYKLEANVTEVDLGIDKSYAKVEDTWLPSGEQVEANPEETSETPLTKIKIDGVTYYIAAGGSAEIVPLTKAEWDALPASKYTDNILYLITDSFTTETIITPNPEGEATDTLTKLQIDETIYSLAGGSGAAAIEKTQNEYDALTPEQKENGAIYMVQNKGEETRTQFDMTNITTYKESSMSVSTSISETIVSWNGDTAIGCTSFYTNPIDVTDIDYITYELETGSCYGNGSEAQQVRWRFDVGYASVAPSGVGNQEIFEEYNEHKYSNTIYTDDECVLDVRNVTGNIYIIINSHGWNATLSNIELVSGSSEVVNRIYYMGTEYANTNGGSGGGGEGYTETILWSGSETTNKWVEPIVLNNINIDEYDALAIQVNVSQHIVSTEQIPIGDASASSVIAVNGFLNTNGENVVGIWLNKGNNLLRIFTATNVTIVLTKVVGIKYGSSGGSSIIPNPEEEPTDTLNSVKIDGTVYNIESSSEGEGIEIYSEDEYIVGKWIDGKKLYQKSIKFSATSLPASWTTIEQDVDYNLVFPEVQCLYYTANGEPFTQSTRVFVQNGELKIQPLKELDLLSSTLKHVITIRYTKTVETPAPAWGGSITNNYANFINTNNVIYSTVSSSASDTYTATEDCYIMQDIVVGTNVATVQIDGETVAEYSFSGTQLLSYNAYLKKGQTITVTHGATSAHTIKVFGITYASGGSSSESSVHYSTTEQIIGTWIDGKPLYQKSYENLNIGTVQNYTLTLSDLQNIEYFRVVPEGSQVSVSIPFPYVHYGTENLIGYFTDVTNGVPSLEIRKGSTASFSNLQFLTIQYTKTTD